MENSISLLFSLSSICFSSSLKSVKTGLESSENGLDFWDFYGDDLWDRVNGGLASYDEVLEQQTYRQGHGQSGMVMPKLGLDVPKALLGPIRTVQWCQNANDLIRNVTLGCFREASVLPSSAKGVTMPLARDVPRIGLALPTGCRCQQVSNEVLEYGEETYFPALHVSLDNPSAVSIPVLTISFFSSLKYDVI
ncbi:hypothetical protein LOK49_LG11G01360 [Camellia lanceoleosa]|uniref:Uncharacterized protein n=1 Tax=Camellia lanceoleosa TaxID=1840588 RepID=A0ACC0G0U1_9ERIC|nr:hypothetical protein LOK49_LG11G01360 [Camellia lanceoleosa]